MKMTILFVICLVSGLKADESVKLIDYNQLIDALIAVESGGDDNVVGDKKLRNKAYGCLQIRQPVCDDINRRFNTKHRAEDCLGDRNLSIEICKKYLSMWGDEKSTDEKLARIWNGGPKGFNKKSTEVYWAKVQKVLEMKEREKINKE